MHAGIRSAVVALLLCVAVPAAAQSVHLEFDDGKVTLSARNAPVRIILAEWARLGGTEIVDGDRVPGAPVTLELTQMPERQALDILLRGASGYLIGPRQTASGQGSAISSLLILPASRGPATPPPPAVGTSPPPPPLPDFDDFPDVNFDDQVPRLRMPRDFVPPDGPDGQPMPPQPYQPDPDEVPAQGAPGGQPAQPGFPFGIPGAARPGEIVPIPGPSSGGQPQIDDDP